MSERAGWPSRPAHLYSCDGTAHWLGAGAVLNDMKFKRKIASLDRIFAFTERFFDSQSVDPEDRFAVNFAVEELFTNMVKYNADHGQDILIDLACTDGQLTVRLTDYDVEPFDVTKAPPADVDSSIESRQPGGLGLHLVPRMVDSLDYEYVDRESRITFTKKVG